MIQIVSKDKVDWLTNTIENLIKKYIWEIQLRNIFVKYNWEIKFGNVFANILGLCGASIGNTQQWSGPTIVHNHTHTILTLTINNISINPLHVHHTRELNWLMLNYSLYWSYQISMFTITIIVLIGQDWLNRGLPGGSKKGVQL